MSRRQSTVVGLSLFITTFVFVAIAASTKSASLAGVMMGFSIMTLLAATTVAAGGFITSSGLYRDQLREERKLARSSARRAVRKADANPADWGNKPHVPKGGFFN